MSSAQEGAEKAQVSAAEKLMIARQVGEVMAGDSDQLKKDLCLAIVKELIHDVSVEVRTVLARELRSCADLDKTVAEKLARDVEDVACPFLKETQVFDDEELAALIPLLADHAHITIAKRPDIGGQTQVAIVQHAGDNAVLSLVRNRDLVVTHKAMDKVAERFLHNRPLMDHLAKRVDLPLEVMNKIVTAVSDEARGQLMRNYKVKPEAIDKPIEQTRADIYQGQMKGRSSAQIHAMVRDIRERGNLTHNLTIKLARLGNVSFMISSLALESGLPLMAIKNTIRSDERQAFITLMQQVKASPEEAEDYLMLFRQCRSVI